MGRWSAVRATEALTWGAHGLGPLTPGAGCAQASSTVHGRLQQGGACANGRKGQSFQSRHRSLPLLESFR